jgi:hypothetical protein
MTHGDAAFAALEVCTIRVGEVLVRTVTCIAALVAGFVVGAPHGASAHEGELVLRQASTADGGGALTIEYDFTKPVVLAFDVAVGDVARYTALDPFFVVHEDDEPEESLFRLDDGTEVTFELVAIDDAVAVRLNGANLVAPGATAVIGTMPDLHGDPQWQLTLPEDVVNCRQVTFRLVTSAPQYTASEPYTLTLTNDPDGNCGTCGDADGNGTVTLTDGVNVLRGAAGLPGACDTSSLCDVDGNGTLSVTDGVNVLRAAAALPASLTCAAP